jgi:peptidoglycan hydrolase-like protein with peptidoglycan-binding domain
VVSLTVGRIGTAAAFLAVGVVLGWSVSTLFSPPPPLPSGAAYSLVEVTTAELSRSLTLNAAASWTGGDQLINRVNGVLTERLVASGDRVASGDVLYTVNLAPIAVAQGDVPAFRPLVPGFRGADVKQLQNMLIATGQRTAAPNGYFDSATLDEYKEWQRATGWPVTGTAPLGSLLFVSRLPAVIGWQEGTGSAASGAIPTDAKGVVGTKLADGDVVAQLLPPTPSFSIELPPGQRRLVEPGMPVRLSLGQHRWQATLASIGAPRDDGSAIATLAPADRSGSICGDDCASIPVEGAGAITATIAVLTARSGPVVPTAALVVDADGSAAVVTSDGETVQVTVKATTGGQALIDGIAPGTKVRVPGEGETVE